MHVCANTNSCTANGNGYFTSTNRSTHVYSYIYTDTIRE